MFKKLLNGEFNLKDTFWKYGVLGFIICNILFKISQKLLSPRLMGYTIKNYYTTYIGRIAPIDSLTVALTIFYIACICLLISYSYVMVIGVWRSSAEYNKSLWLRHLSRLFILIFAALSLRGMF